MLEEVRAHLMSSVRIGKEQMLDLLSGRYHSSHVRRQRAGLMIGRVQLVSAIFAVLTPLWIIVDALAFPWPEWGALAVLRVVSSLGFALLAWPWEAIRTETRALVMLLLMLAIPPVFYLISIPLFDGLALSGFSRVVADGYGLLPFVMVAGLSVFPLTALEVGLFTVPVIAISVFGAVQAGSFGLESYAGTLWLLTLVIGVSMLSGMSQLHYLIVLVNKAIHDPLTDALTRRSGGETLDLLFRVAATHEQPICVMFFDIDNFKSINDGYGHDAGDTVLRGASGTLRQHLRRGDMLVRWGGEEFVAVLPNTDAKGARLVVERIRRTGLGQRPDGRNLTASMGLAERQADRIDDWPRLVDLADRRMYQAKKSGKDRCIGCGDELII